MLGSPRKSKLSKILSMNESVSGSEPQRTAEIGKRARMINKACLPCRARKVKCDAAVTGVPCRNCTGRQSAEDCVLLVRKPRKRSVDIDMTVNDLSANIYGLRRKVGFELLLIFSLIF
jgi:hypothetical protein